MTNIMTELSWREHGCLQRQLVLQVRVHECVVEQTFVLPVMEEIVTVLQEMVPVPQIFARVCPGGEFDAARASATTDRRAYHRCPSASDIARGCRVGKVGPTGTRATHRRANCGGAYSTNHGGDCRRVQNCTTGEHIVYVFVPQFDAV